MPIRRIYTKWAVRHRHPLSLALHLVGIPMTVAALPVLIFRSAGEAAALFLGGYGLQFLGHAAEGNTPGELMLLEKLLSRRRKGRAGDR